MELISPAGNLEKLKTAFAFGSDAVYCGMPEFSLRVRINEFDMAALREGVEYAHERGKKVYVTLNIFAHNKHLVALEKHVAELKNIGVDALVVSDPGVLQVVKKVWPEVKIHLSTQANCTNAAAARFWFERGVGRIILAREVTLEEIKQIHAAVPDVELEYFIHGAMCMSYSGRCLLSKYFSDRSANLGDCTQPCRWKYQVQSRKSQFQSEWSKVVEMTEESRPEQLLEMEEDEHGSYIMNSKDLCLVEYLRELEEAGIVAGKIEGRAKSVYYVGVATKVYRQALEGRGARVYPIPKRSDWYRGKGQRPARKATLSVAGGSKGKSKGQEPKIKSKKYSEELKKCQNRGFTSGFLFGEERCEQNTDAGHEKCEWEFCGQTTNLQITHTNNTNNAERTTYSDWGEVVKVVGVEEQKRLVAVMVHNQIFVGDEIELVVPRGENIAMTVEKMYDEKGVEISEAHGGQGKVIWLEMACLATPLPDRTLVRRRLQIP